MQQQDMGDNSCRLALRSTDLELCDYPASMPLRLHLWLKLSVLVLQLAGDGDVEVCVNAVSLRCPLTAMRIKKPAHFTTAPGLAYFDLDSFLEMTQRSGKWQVGT